ncbi:ROK family protein [Phreatobacter aquaticus]|uniref:ROK family protein n=1 Tax=Phreatobacter aquaticus TaxID=2570229 RepID=A0A4D7QG11_9HYPH|nr:ROK family protein [Phreatobacter aquaticus]QCK85895.1 ROK family protein [Phreatobacter aquaticus]
MRIGIDLGGTKIEILALDDEGRECLRRRVPTPRHDYRAIVDAISSLVGAAEAELGVTATVGVGIPGAVSPATGLVKNANTVVLIGQPLDRDLGAALGRPVRVENDANCFVLSEAVDGAGRGADVVFGAILGTGVGAGIIIGGRIIPGRHLIAGEWGHNPLPWPSVEEVVRAPTCYCGRKGCLETWVSGPAFASDFKRQTGRETSSEAIIAEAVAGEAPAVAAYDAYLDRLARGLAHVVNILDPDVIILGGGMGKIERLYADLPTAVRPYVFSDAFTTPIRPPTHGDSSGVRGAAWLWPADPTP